MVAGFPIFIPFTFSPLKYVQSFIDAYVETTSGSEPNKECQPISKCQPTSECQPNFESNAISDLPLKKSEQQYSSMEDVPMRECYPLKATTFETEGLAIPYPLVLGEYVEYIGRMPDGVVAMSNYRVYLSQKDSCVNIPLGLIESVEYRDMFCLVIYCKDVKTFRCTFGTNEQCLDWFKRLGEAKSRTKLQDVFALACYAWSFDAKGSHKAGPNNILELPDPTEISTEKLKLKSDSLVFDREVERLGFKLAAGGWRITHTNKDYSTCDTYPKLHIVPYSITDEEINKISGFRSCRRFPSVVWRDRQTGVVLARSSQPSTGLFWWRSNEDENFIRAMGALCEINKVSAEAAGTNSERATNDKDSRSKVNKNVLIIDARSYGAAIANRAKGGGCECEEYYPNCNIMFMNLANIHVIRKSFVGLRTLCSASPDEQNWLMCLEATKWLHHINGLLRSAMVVVEAISRENKSVLVHCSDGWDRTPQIVALAELMLDPYYRTCKGFHVLVEKEWLSFGHKFADRCGQGLNSSTDANERCPVFLQWLDCVHQLMHQFPCAFQFNESYLIKLVQHTYSCLFGDFLCNSDKQRSSESMENKTMSVWKHYLFNNPRFTNQLYRESSEQILRPACSIQEMHFWSAVYVTQSTPVLQISLLQEEATKTETNIETKNGNCLCKPAKVHSFDDLEVEKLKLDRMPKVPISNEYSFEMNGVKDSMFRTDLKLSETEIQPNETLKVRKRSNSFDSGNEHPRSCNSSSSTLQSLSLEILENKDMKEPSESSEGPLQQNGVIDDEFIPRPASPTTVDNTCDDSSVASTETNGVTYVDAEYQVSNDRESSSTKSPTDDEFQEAVESRENGSDVIGMIEMSDASRNKVVPLNAAREWNGYSANNRDVDFGCAQRHHNCPISQDKVCDICPFLVSMQQDWDGLSNHVDPIQQRMAQIRAEYECRISSLQAEMMEMRFNDQKCNCSHNCCYGPTDDNRDEVASNDSSERGSGESWELLTDRNEHLTRWMPNHAVEACGSCEVTFGLMQRKHHCRICGNIFCCACTSIFIPVPRQQLNTPSRVCFKCYKEEMASLS